MGTASTSQSKEDRVAGCLAAALISIVGLLLALVGLVWWASTLPDFDIDIGPMFGDPCRESVEMPAEIGVATERSVLVGWEGECPLVLWLGYVRTTWLYATDEPPETVRAIAFNSLRQYLAEEGLESTEVHIKDASVVGSGIDHEHETAFDISVTLFVSPPPMYRFVAARPQGYTTFYTVSELLKQAPAPTPVTPSVAPTATFGPLPTATPTPTATTRPTAMPTPTPRRIVFRQISAGLDHTCGLTSSGSILCWGGDAHGQATPPDGKFTAVSTGYGVSCGLREDRTAACWGSQAGGEAWPPAGEFLALSDTCGIGPAGGIQCWGWERDAHYPSSGNFTALSVNRHGCALAVDGTLHCWLGSYFESKPGTEGGDYGQARPPSGKFIAVTAGGFHTCGLRENLTAECWGRQNQPPEGKYTAISAGNWHTCALRFDGGVACWGMSKGVVVPPGPFVAISSGGSHACGLRPDGIAVCWGDNSSGQASPP